MAKKEKNLFDFIAAINNKTKIEYDKKKANSWILSLWISHSAELIETTNKINPYINILTDEAIFNYYFYAIPKKKRFIKWIKKDETKEEKDNLEGLMEKHNISRREAKLCLIK